ncbi:MAG TPA: hypothetical protein VER33_11650 [Polyangiaceae bacterium]|nr:hypothetical protein [Polyangiaceae bacterium]
MDVEAFLATQSTRLSPTLLIERCYATAFAALTGDDNLLAERLFGYLVLLAPRDSRAWVGLGTSKERLGEVRAAAGVYGVGAALSSEPCYCWVARARALMRSGRVLEAEQAFDAAESSCGEADLSAWVAAQRRAT